MQRMEALDERCHRGVKSLQCRTFLPCHLPQEHRRRLSDFSQGDVQNPEFCLATISNSSLTIQPPFEIIPPLPPPLTNVPPAPLYRSVTMLEMMSKP